MLLNKLKEISYNRKYNKFVSKRGNESQSFISTSVRMNEKTMIGKYCNINAGNIENANIGNCCLIQEADVRNTKIGNFCSLGKGIRVIPCNHPINDFISTSPCFYNTYLTFSINNPFKYDKEMLLLPNGFSIEIGNDVWIGDNVLIKGGITIGDGAVIGMGSIVTKNVEPYSVVVGNPAKEIKKRFNANQIEKLLKIKWWFWDIDKIRLINKEGKDINEFIKMYDK